MLYQFNHKVLSSFYLWFERQLLGSSVKAYATDKANTFQYVGAAETSSDYLMYQGEFRQLVADETVDKVNSGVFINGAFVSGDSSDIFIDYNDGRVIVPTDSGVDLTITANSTVKEVNTYLTNEDPENLLLEHDFVIQGAEADPYLTTQANKRDDKVYMIPACFISLENFENSPFCFGGEDETTIRVRVFVVTPDTYTRDGVLSLFADKERSVINLISSETDFPYGAFFGLKSYPYNYDTLAAAQPTSSADLAHIEKVYATKVSREFTDQHNRSFLFGFIDFDLVTARFPRL